MPQTFEPKFEYLKKKSQFSSRLHMPGEAPISFRYFPNQPPIISLQMHTRKKVRIFQAKPVPPN